LEIDIRQRVWRSCRRAWPTASGSVGTGIYGERGDREWEASMPRETRYWMRWSDSASALMSSVNETSSPCLVSHHHLPHRHILPLHKAVFPLLSLPTHFSLCTSSRGHLSYKTWTPTPPASFFPSRFPRPYSSCVSRYTATPRHKNTLITTIHSTLLFSLAPPSLCRRPPAKLTPTKADTLHPARNTGASYFSAHTRSCVSILDTLPSHPQPQDRSCPPRP
jgi:hypothetical protein